MNKNTSLKKSKKNVWKIISWVIAGLLIVAVIGYAAISLWSRVAVDNFRIAAADQINGLINGSEDDSSAVTLQSIPLAGVIYSDYKKVDDLQSQYQKLLSGVRGYQTNLATHNELVRQYNNMLNIARDNSASAEVTKILNDMADTYAKYSSSWAIAHPDQTAQANELKSLSERCRAAADDTANGVGGAYKSIMSDSSDVIHRYESTLADDRQAIDRDLDDFQSRIN